MGVEPAYVVIRTGMGLVPPVQTFLDRNYRPFLARGEVTVLKHR
jgi:hypothetical protein